MLNKLSLLVLLLFFVLGLVHIANGALHGCSDLLWKEFIFVGSAFETVHLPFLRVAISFRNVMLALNMSAKPRDKKRRYLSRLEEQQECKKVRAPLLLEDALS